MTAEATHQKQSRLGKRPVSVPKGVEVKIANGKVNVKGPKGSLEKALPPKVTIKQEGEELVVQINADAGTEGPKFQGLARALLANYVTGVSEGYKKSLDLYGVGYRAELKGQALTLNVGLSHQVHYTLPDSVKGKVETIDEAGTKRPRLHLDSVDKEVLGLAAARIRSFRPPEPYKGKGVRYTGERIRTKAGKAGAKG